ncbi:MAG: hypothetical protein FWG50_12145 [Kiritimatiellaeota bacterium]|nr:hypothetical protein [Kiritimatiellota bacterium]
MKAKFGKISIGCFIVFLLSVGVLFFIPNRCGCAASSPVMLIVFFPHIIREIFAEPTSGDNPIAIAVYSYYLLCLFAGIALGVAGAVKKEIPKRYYLTGLWLNLGLLLLLALYAVWLVALSIP